MPLKRNRNGLQHYDWRGRYCESPEARLERINKEKMMAEARRWIEKKESNKYFVQCLRNRATHKNDPYLVEAFDLINSVAPDSIKKVNEYINDSNGIKREIDILTKHCLVEVKKTGKGSLNQLVEQLKYCKIKKLNHIVYSPEMTTGRLREFEKHGLTIIRKRNGLVDIIRRLEK